MLPALPTMEILFHEKECFGGAEDKDVLSDSGTHISNITNGWVCFLEGKLFSFLVDTMYSEISINPLLNFLKQGCQTENSGLQSIPKAYMVYLDCVEFKVPPEGKIHFSFLCLQRKLSKACLNWEMYCFITFGLTGL